MKEVFLDNSRHLRIIFETGDNVVLKINSFVTRKLLLDRSSNVNLVSEISR